MTTPTKKPAKGPRRRHNDQDWERTGETLRQLRLDRDITQSQLATAVGFLNSGSIAQIEKGLKPLTDGKLIAAARFLDVSPLAIRRPEEFKAAS
jgi:transcriptional regulator with XRE-family HTH domain